MEIESARFRVNLTATLTKKMTNLTLIIGNKSYSSWSLRPWVLMKHSNIVFNEIRLPLCTPQWQEQINQYSPSGKVPVLLDGELRVWDSLAICEYLAEKFPDSSLWPKNGAPRAVARSVSAEMHSGFADLREHMSMNCRGRFPGRGITEAVTKDIQRVVNIWDDCLRRYGAQGDFLFGQFSIADAMFAPVCLRFITYEVALEGLSSAYMHRIHNLPAIQEWIRDARGEVETIERYEMYGGSE